jgi:hypothetical protein
LVLVLGFLSYSSLGFVTCYKTSTSVVNSVSLYYMLYGNGINSGYNYTKQSISIKKTYDSTEVIKTSSKYVLNDFEEFFSFFLFFF